MIVAQGTDGLGSSLSVSTGNVDAIELDGFPNPFKLAKKAVGAVLSVPKKILGGVFGGGGGSSAALTQAQAEQAAASKFPVVPVAIAGVAVLGAAAFLLTRSSKATASRARRRGKR